MKTKTIAHFVETYPLTQYKYIYDQIVDTPDKKNIVLTERLAGRPLHKNLYFFRTISNNVLLDKLDNFMTDRFLFGNKVYLKSLQYFYSKSLKFLKPSIMHAHFGMVGYKLAKLKRELNIPLVITFYGADVSYCLNQKRWLKRYEQMFEAADRFIVLCKESFERLRRHGCPGDKIRLWNIGLDLENYPYQERKISQTVKFIIVARFVENKGYEVLLKAFCELLKCHEKAMLTLVGFGPFKKRIVNLIRYLNIKENTTVIDTSAEKDFYGIFKNLLYDHDIFVLPSTTSKNGEDEGGPALTMIYAQSTGLPVIATPFPGAEISVTEGETGLFCEYDNPKLLAEKMHYLIKNVNLRKEIGLKGNELVNKQFLLSRQLNELNNIYNEVI